eukprot:scaffold5639_cov70-Cyclotella_meneghiniana.AAC.1
MPFLPNPTTCGQRLNSQRLLGCGRALNDGVMVEEVQACSGVAWERMVFHAGKLAGKNIFSSLAQAKEREKKHPAHHHDAPTLH